MISIHQVHDSGGGLESNALTEFRHFHYRGLGATSSEPNRCKTREGEGGGLQMDDVAVLASRARRCPLGSPKVRMM